MKQKGVLRGVLLGVVLFSGLAYAPHVAALVGPHDYANTSNGDVFLGGDYIELGISNRGSFGTHTGVALPTGFYGTAGHTNIGMSTNPTGFGVAPDLRMDFFLPGTPEERWVVGYKQGGTPTTGSNSLLMNVNDMPDNTVTDQTSGTVLKATSQGTLSSTLQTTQVISFNSGDKFFKNQVTLKNVSASSIDSARYMRTFDPDNTAYLGGLSQTHNTIPYTYQAGDGKSVVIADTNVAGHTDPVFAQNGSYSPILFYSDDSRARVSTFGFSNSDPYAASAYDSALPKGTSVDADQAITITFDVGTLAPGASQTFNYYTSLDNRDFTQVISAIQAASAPPADDSDNISTAVENAGPNAGDANGDGIKDSLQSNVSALPNSVVGGGAYEALQTSGCDTITQAGVTASSAHGSDGNYQYPLGLTNFTVSCAAPGNTATVKIFYDKQYDTSKWQARKYMNGSYQNIPGAVFGVATVGTAQVTTLTYSITDGGPLDADGTANGIIVDPVGPAVLTASAPDTGYGTPQRLDVVLGWLAAAALFSGAVQLFASKRSKLHEA